MDVFDQRISDNAKLAVGKPLDLTILSDIGASPPAAEKPFANLGDGFTTARDLALQNVAYKPQDAITTPLKERPPLPIIESISAEKTIEAKNKHLHFHNEKEKDDAEAIFTKFKKTHKIDPDELNKILGKNDGEQISGNSGIEAIDALNALRAAITDFETADNSLKTPSNINMKVGENGRHQTIITIKS